MTVLSQILACGFLAQSSSVLFTSYKTGRFSARPFSSGVKTALTKQKHPGKQKPSRMFYFVTLCPHLVKIKTGDNCLYQGVSRQSPASRTLCSTRLSHFPNFSVLQYFLVTYSSIPVIKNKKSLEGQGLLATPPRTLVSCQRCSVVSCLSFSALMQPCPVRGRWFMALTLTTSNV